MTRSCYNLYRQGPAWCTQDTAGAPLVTVCSLPKVSVQVVQKLVENAPSRRLKSEMTRPADQRVLSSSSHYSSSLPEMMVGRNPACVQLRFRVNDEACQFRVSHASPQEDLIQTYSIGGSHTTIDMSSKRARVESVSEDGETDLQPLRPKRRRGDSINTRDDDWRRSDENEHANAGEAGEVSEDDFVAKLKMTMSGIYGRRWVCMR